MLEVRRNLRGGSLGIPACALLLLGCPEPREPEPIAHEGPEIVLAGTPEAVLDRMRAGYRLAPDRRFLGAIGALEELFEVSRSDLAVSFDDGVWVVDGIGPEESRELGELPGFEDLYGLVAARAVELAHRHAERWKLVEGPAPGVDERGDPLENLRELDAEWSRGHRTAATLTRAARESCYLLGELTDRMGVADEIVSRAIALVAGAEAVVGRPLWPERACLAVETGYRGAAETMARSLPDETPLAAYSRSDLDALGGAARRAGASARERVRYANALEDLGSVHALREFLADPRTDTMANLRLASLLADANPHGGWNVTHAVNTLLALEASLRAPLEALQEYFDIGNSLYVGARVTARVLIDAKWGRGDWLAFAEDEIDRLERQPGGVLMPSSAQAAFFRAHLFSAASGIGHYYVFVLGSETATDDFRDLIHPRGSTYATQFSRYFAHIVKADRRTLSPESLVADLRQLSVFGVWALEDSFRALRESAKYDKAFLQAIRELAARCDSRLSCREMLRSAALDVFDLPLAEALASTIAGEVGRGYSSAAIWLTYLDGDLDVLESYALDKRLGELPRREALFYLRQKGPPERVARVFERALAEDAASSQTLDAYVSYLWAVEDFDGQVRVLTDWLARHRPSSPLMAEYLSVLLARAQHRSGDLEGAARTLRQFAGSQYGPTMYRAALVLLDLGLTDEAEALAWSRLERYPMTSSVQLVSYILWRSGRYERAAALLANPPRAVTLSEWHENIAPEFLRAFEERPVVEAVRAFEHLVRAGIAPYHLQYLPGAFRYEALPEYSFEMFRRLQIPGIGKFWSACHAYSALKAWQGLDAAQRWLGEKVQPGLRRNLAMYCFESGDYEVAWDLVPDPPGESLHVQYAWLMRAAGWLLTEGERPGWEERLREHYDDRGEHFYDALARHLLGLESVEAIWDRIGAIDQVAEAAYMIALKAHAEGDLRTAIPWYRVAVETEQNQEAEARWAFMALSKLRNMGERIDRMGELRGARGGSAPGATRNAEAVGSDERAATGPRRMTGGR